MEGLSEFFTELRAVVVSSPVPVTLRTLGRDYHSFTGKSLSLQRFGYRDTATFIKEKCSDFFVLQGPPQDPIVTLIVPKSLEHINKMVLRQKLSDKQKMKGKRWSINKPEPTESTPRLEGRNNEVKRPTVQTEQRSEPELQNSESEERNLQEQLANAESGWWKTPTERRNIETNASSNTPEKERRNIEVKQPNVENGWRNTHEEQRNFKRNVSSSTPENERRVYEDKRPNAENRWRNSHEEQRNSERNVSSSTPEKERRGYEDKRLNAENRWRNTHEEQRNSERNVSSSTPEKERRGYEDKRPNAENRWRNTHEEQRNSERNVSSSNPEKERRVYEDKRPNAENRWRNTHEEQRNSERNVSSSTPEKERRGYEDKRPNAANSRQNSHKDGENFKSDASSSTSETDKGRSGTGSTRDSGRPSTSSGRAAALETLAQELAAIVHKHPNGLWALDLVRLYREQYGRELRFERYGASSGIALIRMLEGSVFYVRRPDPFGDWRLYDVHHPPPPDDVEPPAASATALGSDLDAMKLGQTICALTLDDIKPRDLIDILVGEVYSPSHFWLMRRDDDHYGELTTVMEAMNMYYDGPGSERSLVTEMSVRCGLYCAASFEGEWHRALIVALQEEDFVLVRYIDFGTVNSVPITSLKPLLGRWSELPAQAVRARLAGLMPLPPTPHWPHGSCSEFVRLVSNLPLVAEVVLLDYEKRILEVFLVDTSKPEHVCINEILIENMLAVSRNDSVIGKMESHLRPSFEALEEGLAPSFADIVTYNAHRIDLSSVDTYRRHVLDEPPLVAEGARYLTALECTVFAFLLAQNYHVALENACRYQLQLRWQTAPGEPEVLLTTAEFEFLERLRASDALRAALHLDRVIRARLPPSAAYPATPPADLLPPSETNSQ